MTEDLENTLNELGPGYREVVDRLRAHPVPRWRVPALLAAAVVFVLSVAIVFLERPSSEAGDPVTYTIYTVAYAPTEEALDIILASQRADGSWDNDFITRQNAAALRAGSREECRIAYKRAVRYLRSKGLDPLTDEELRNRGENFVHHRG